MTEVEPAATPIKGEVQKLAITVLLAHYNAVRADILSKVETRDRYIYLCIVGSGLIFYFQYSNPQMQEVLFLIPLLILVTSVLFAQVDRIIGMMAKWLKDNYSAEVELYLGHPIDHWDRSLIGNELIGSTVFQARYLSLGVIFVIIGYTALIARIQMAQADDFFGALHGIMDGNGHAAAAFSGHPGNVSKNVIQYVECALFLVVPVIAYLLVRHSGRARAIFHNR